MGRLHGDPVVVTTSEDGRPVRFVWREQVYVVTRVLEHWVTTRDWWRADDPDAENTGEREFWRVECRLGQEIGVFELRYDMVGRAWLLARVWE